MCSHKYIIQDLQYSVKSFGRTVMQRIFFELTWYAGPQLTSQRLTKRLWDDASLEHKNLFNQYCDLGLITREPDPLDYICFLPFGSGYGLVGSSCKTGFIWTPSATLADVTAYAQARDALNAQAEFGYISSEIIVLDEGQHPTDTYEYDFELASSVI